MASSSSTPVDFVVLGAGVAGLTTAVELHRAFPSATIVVVAKYMPGYTSATEYTSPWAGANWHSFEKEPNQFGEYDRVTYSRFIEIAAQSPESGIEPLPLRVLYDTDETRRKGLWYAEHIGGVKEVPKNELPPGAVFGLDMASFMINTTVYLSWLQTQLLQSKKVTFLRRHYHHIDALLNDFPDARAVFNCTGLGARHLGGVDDEAVYPTKGQTILIAQPKEPLKRMYVQTSAAWDNEFAHVFPRPLGGGVIIGGVRRDNDWTGEPDLELAERIKRRCCALAPELGRPEDLQVISHNVGLRPSRKGGARLSLEKRKTRQGQAQKDRLVIHNYGASGVGYQSSWGMAAHAVDLLKKSESKPSSTSTVKSKI
ncbi:D-amino-acid oxidase [Exophiala dermatitidis]